MASLLPKLREQFAEFLKDIYLAPLGRLLPIHLCQFRVRLINFSNLELFLEVFKRFFQFETIACFVPLLEN